MAPPTVSTSRKRPIKVEPGGSSGYGEKRPKTAKKQEASGEELKEQFLSLFSEEEYEDGVPNGQLKNIFGEKGLDKVVPIINDLLKEARLTMSKMDGNEKELYYRLVPEEIAVKFAGLDSGARLVYV